MEIHKAVKKLLSIVDDLQSAYPHKKFTLDGRLVGDLGEILVEQDYDLKLYEGLEKHHDGITSSGKKVQIKTTMKNALTFPVDHIPDFYIGIKIDHNGKYSEIFNGPGSIAAEAIKNRKPTKTNLHSISLSALKTLNSKVMEKDRIMRRTPKK